MKYAAVHIAWLSEDKAPLDADDAALGAWLRLLAHASSLELGEGAEGEDLGHGRIPGCGTWSERAWLRATGTDLAGVASAVGADLAWWDGEDLLVAGYDLRGQSKVRQARENGAKGGRPRKERPQKAAEKPPDKTGGKPNGKTKRQPPGKPNGNPDESPYPTLPNLSQPLSDLGEYPSAAAARGGAGGGGPGGPGASPGGGAAAAAAAAAALTPGGLTPGYVLGRYVAVTGFPFGLSGWQRECETIALACSREDDPFDALEKLLAYHAGPTGPIQTGRLRQPNPGHLAKFAPHELDIATGRVTPLPVREPEPDDGGASQRPDLVDLPPMQWPEDEESQA